MFPCSLQYALLVATILNHLQLMTCLKVKQIRLPYFKAKCYTHEDEEQRTTVLSTSNIGCNVKVIFFGLSQEEGFLSLQTV